MLKKIKEYYYNFIVEKLENVKGKVSVYHDNECFGEFDGRCINLPEESRFVLLDRTGDEIKPLWLYLNGKNVVVVKVYSAGNWTVSDVELDKLAIEDVMLLAEIINVNS